MAAKRIGKAGLRAGFDALVTYVVDPKGRIKTIRYHYNVSSPLLNIEVGRRQVRQIDLSLGAKDAGYAFLEDLYKEEDNEEGWQAWLSYQQALENGEVGQDAVTQRERVNGRETEVEHLVTQQFPDEMLPREVLRRRGQIGTEKRWSPPRKRRTKKGKDDGEAAPELA